MGFTRRDIYLQISQENKIPLAEVTEICEQFLSILQDRVRSGESIQLRGFGTFSLVQRSAKTGWDPIHKVKVQLPEGKRLKFLPSKEWTKSET